MVSKELTWMQLQMNSAHTQQGVLIITFFVGVYRFTARKGLTMDEWWPFHSSSSFIEYTGTHATVHYGMWAGWPGNEAIALTGTKDGLTFLYSCNCVLNAGDSCSPMTRRHEKLEGSFSWSRVRWGLYCWISVLCVCVCVWVRGGGGKNTDFLQSCIQASLNIECYWHLHSLS